MISFRRATARLRPFLSLGLVATGALLLPETLSGQNQPAVAFGGEIRPRFFGREPVGGQWDSSISMRSRLALDARFQNGLGLFVQIQDVRFWGEESSNRDGSADAVDFHQAFLQVDSLPGIGGSVRVGRQEITFGEGRFIAAPEWGQAGQSFDGALWDRSMGGSHVDVVYLRLQEGSSSVHEFSADLTAAWLTLPESDLGSWELLLLHDRSSETAETHRTTVGPTWKKRVGSLSFRAEGMLQFGETAGQDLSAFMVAARSTVEVLGGRGTITLWYDQLSGDSNPTDGDRKAFSTLFGGRHRYYGRGDYFLDIPEDTEGLGLKDRAIKLEYRPSDLTSLNLDLHSFRTDQRGHLSSQSLAEELDFWARHRFRDHMVLEAGYVLTWANTAMEELGLLVGTGNTAYFMTSLRF